MFSNYNWTDALNNFYLSLRVMGLGMLSIFIVILALLTSVMLLAKFTGKKDDQD